MEKNPVRTLDDASSVLLTPVWLEINCVGYSGIAWLGGEGSQSKDFGGRSGLSPGASYAHHVTSLGGWVFRDLYLHCTLTALPLLLCHIFSLSFCSVGRAILVKCKTNRASVYTGGKIHELLSDG